MSICKTLAFVLPVFALLTPVRFAPATEYFVSNRGADTHAGTTRETAFATVQKGIDTLMPGDSLTIAPGEYREGIKRADLGNLEHETVIRAELPGTVTLRGDLPAPEFRRLPGHRFVYVADFKFAGPIPAVNEIDTLTILKRMPNSAELEFIPGTFYHDAVAGKLYVSTSDMKPVESHRYSVSIIPTSGIHLIRPRRVTIEGIAVTGFSAMELMHYREETAGGIWGIFCVHGKSCVVRDCRAYLNAWGIGFNSVAPGSGDNVIDRCVSWGNKSPFANGDMGGITVFAARRDAIRRSVAYLNGMYGVNIYGTGGAPPNADDGGNTEANKSLLEENLAWGNETADIKIKTGYEYFHIAKNCVSPGLWSVTNISHGTIGRATTSERDQPSNDILLGDIPAVDLPTEFADPANHDYRLQATSRFRGKGINGADSGAIPYQANVYYLRPDGDDQADGLSMACAWKSLARAVRQLRAEDTLYLEPGEYQGDVDVQLAGNSDSPIAIRGRGRSPVQVQGTVRLKESKHLKLEHLEFNNQVTIDGGEDIAVNHCRFVATDTSLQATGVRGLTVSQNAFAWFRGAALDLKESSQVDLSGNLFETGSAPAVKLADSKQIRYSNYNCYFGSVAVWDVNGQPWELRKVHEQHDQQSVVAFASTSEGSLQHPIATLIAAGPFGKPLGPFYDEPRRSELRLVGKPTVHSVSATTANLEWTTSLPATCHLAWGESPACEHSLPFNVNCFGTYSLTGLAPGKTYYFRITKIETPADILPKTDHHQSVSLSDAPVTFTTLAANPAPRTYYVATDGDDNHSGLDRQNAWRSIRHAAAKVNVGDTVLIAGGKYLERVRLRATGEQGNPITFGALPGERVELNGNDMTLNSGFVASGKSHLRFDGFYFAQFNLFPNDSWSLLNNGEFQLYMGKDIQITRCWSEGRGGYSASPVTAFHVEDLLIRNCVNTYKFGGMYFWRCPNLRIENTVFAEPMIMAFVLRNEKHQKSTLKNCIFTDMLDKKARLNLGILCCDGAIDGFQCPSNCYFLRDCIPLEQRVLQGKQTLSDLRPYVLDPVFADPQFAGDPGVKGNPADKSGFSPDRMMDSVLKLDFDAFFSLNPELIRRDIGLQREAFKDYPFSTK